MGVSGSQENSERKPVVLVVGGGYGGIECAKALDKTNRFFVVLIDRKSYFLHNVAALRATVEEDFARKIIIPYDRLLSYGCVVQAEVISISTKDVQVHGRVEPIPFDYLVIATGSSYAFPGKIAEPNIAKAIDLYTKLREKIVQAEKILVIGGGPVGVEMAAEIATDFPDKTVTLVHSQKTLLTPNMYNERLYPRLHEQLERLRVQMILDDRIVLPNNQLHVNYLEGRKTFVTERSKQSITADLTFVCIGAHVNNKSLFNGPLKSKIHPESGRLLVNHFLQVDGYENLFAIGDICEKEEKFAYLAGEQGKYVAKAISLLEQNKPLTKEYQIHPNRAIFLSLGRDGGIGQLPTKSGTLIGNFPMKHLKSKNMFAGRYQSALNYKTDNPTENKSAYMDRLNSMQSSLSLTEDEAQSLIAGLPVKDPEPGQNFI